MKINTCFKLISKLRKAAIIILIAAASLSANAQWYGTPPSNFTWYYSDQGTISPSGCSQSSPVLQYNVSPNSYFIAYNFSGVAGTTYTFTLNPTINVCATGTCEIQLFDYAYNQAPGSVIFDQFGPIPQTKVWTCPVSQTYYLSLSDCSNGQLFGALGVENVTFTYSSDGAVTAPSACTAISSPANNSTCRPTNQQLNWNAVACATGYYLYLGTDAAATNIQNGLNVGNVTTWNPGALTNCTRYYWKIVPYNGIGTGTCAPAIWNFTVGTAPTAAISASASPTPICIGSSTTLTANGGNPQCGSWQWYSGSCGGTPAGTGSSIVVSPTVTTTYYVRAEACSNTACRNVTVTVNANPTITSQPSNQTVCTNTNANFTVATSAGSPTYQWQMSSNNSTWFNVANGTPTGVTYTNATSASLTVNGTSAVALYYYRCVVTVAGGCSTNSNSATLTINAYPLVNAIGGGAPTVMVSATTPAFTNSTPGGTWSITNGTGSASINGAGVATGISTGTVTVNYSVTSGGCTTTVTTILTITAIMPVELIYFNVTCVDVNAIAGWATATEINNDYFTIERGIEDEEKGTSAIQFTPIGTIKGAGNSSTVLKYEFTDTELSSHYSLLTTHYLYYRLKQTDFDGKYKYFGPTSTTCAPSDEGQLILETFSSDVLRGRLNVAEDGNVMLAIIDVQGRSIKKEKLHTFKGANFLQIDISNLNSGLYFIKATTPIKNIVCKFVKL